MSRLLVRFNMNFFKENQIYMFLSCVSFLGINVSDKKCSKCGTVCDFKAKFCSECGVPLVEKMPSKAVEKMPSKAINVVQTTKGNAQSRVKKLDQMWQCVHCTFMNPFETTVCGMCDRTSWKTSVDMKHADAEQSNVGILCIIV